MISSTIKNFSKNLLSILFLTLLLFIPNSLLYASFNFREYSLFFFPTVIILYLTTYITNRSLFNCLYLPHAFCAVLWSFTYPIIYSLSAVIPENSSASLTFYHYHHNYLFGMVYFLLVILLQYTTKDFINIKINSLFFAILDAIIITIPLVIIVYYFIFKSIITTNTIKTIFLTTPREALEFISSTLTNINMLLFIIFYLSYITISYMANQKLLIKYNENKKKNIFIYIFTPMLFIYTIFGLLPYTTIMVDIREVYHYIKSLDSYKLNNQKVYNSLKFVEPINLSNKPQTIILVIGESAGRDFMHVYNNKYPYMNTPWETTVKNTDNNFIFFNNAYSAYTITIMSLQEALTASNQFNRKPISDVPTIINIAQKAGYKTYWFSNQDFAGYHNEPVSLMGKTAEKSIWISSGNDNVIKSYDHDLIELLKSVNPNDNNFIVLHLMGSHFHYIQRYPQNFNPFNDTSTKPNSPESYSNTIAYTDSFLEKTFKYAKKHFNLSAMIYFSDHGEDMIYKHTADHFTFSMVRIPLWIYLSPEYQHENKSISDNLRLHKNNYFTNDFMFDTISGILNAKTQYYNPKMDLSNREYAFNKENTVTMLGKIKISDDAD